MREMRIDGEILRWIFNTWNLYSQKAADKFKRLSVPKSLDSWFLHFIFLPCQVYAEEGKPTEYKATHNYANSFSSLCLHFELSNLEDKVGLKMSKLFRNKTRADLNLLTIWHSHLWLDVSLGEGCLTLLVSWLSIVVKTVAMMMTVSVTKRKRCCGVVAVLATKGLLAECQAQSWPWLWEL